jgi:hypothetical protein
MEEVEVIIMLLVATIMCMCSSALDYLVVLFYPLQQRMWSEILFMDMHKLFIVSSATINFPLIKDWQLT